MAMVAALKAMVSVVGWNCCGAIIRERSYSSSSSLCTGPVTTIGSSREASRKEERGTKRCRNHNSTNRSSDCYSSHSSSRRRGGCCSSGRRNVAAFSSKKLSG